LKDKGYAIVLAQPGCVTSTHVSIARSPEYPFLGGWAKNPIFFDATFSAGAYFSHATFSGRAGLSATYSGIADFSRAIFSGDTYFSHTTFSRLAFFNDATFSGDAHFYNATFSGETDFSETTFSGETDFTEILFESNITFQRSHLDGRTVFTSKREVDPRKARVFSVDTDVDFRDLVLKSPESLSFRDADLRTCRFLNTDLRKAELTAVRWPRKGARDVVHDEEILRATLKKDRLWSAAPKERCTEFCTRKTGKCALCEAIAEANLFLWGWMDIFRRQTSEKVYPWEQIERLYRELKQHHEDRRNYARSGDFHYGEKEMQRHNPSTPPSLKVFLCLYWLVSGYGERFLRPIVCALVLLIGATVAYLWWGLVPKAPLLSPIQGAVSRPAPLSITQPNDWLSAVHYSFRVMTLLKPDDLEPIGFAKVVQTLQSLLGPLFLGLFGLAVRQRLKH
jgi:hypothetical protein